MREYTIVAWCDACPGASRKQSAQTYTVGITEGEERPTLHTVDLCNEHAAMMNAVAKLIVGAQVFTSGPGRPRRSTVIPARSELVVIPSGSEAIPAAPLPSIRRRTHGYQWPTVDCPVCGESKKRNSLPGHIWTQHRYQPKPPGVTQCPDCAFSDPDLKLVGMHRRARHGYNALKEALGDLAVLPAELQDEPLAEAQEPEQEPGIEPEPAPVKQRREKPKDYCPICGNEMHSSSLVGHVWLVHRRSEKRPASPTKCPDCNYSHPKREIVGIHRAKRHGYDPLAEALAGVKMTTR